MFVQKFPLVSLVMPAYNCERYIAEAIDSILNQSYSNIELLISDDASTDNTKKIIDSFVDNRIRRFHNKENQGYLKTWNSLMQQAKGDFITFLDADDTSEKNRIELLLHAFYKNPNIGICGSNYNRINDSGDILETSNFPLFHKEIIAGFPEKFYFVGSAVMIKREVYEQIGGYNTFFNRMGLEDIYWIYLILEKFQMINIPQVLYSYRYNQTSVSVDLSDNPSKVNGIEILRFLIKQRQFFGSDWLSEGKENLLKQKLYELNEVFIKDKAYYFYYIAKRRFYEGHKASALKYMRLAIRKKPFRLQYYRDYLYFLRS